MDAAIDKSAHVHNNSISIAGRLTLASRYARSQGTMRAENRERTLLSSGQLPKWDERLQKIHNHGNLRPSALPAELKSPI